MFSSRVACVVTGCSAVSVAPGQNREATNCTASGQNRLVAKYAAPSTIATAQTPTTSLRMWPPSLPVVDLSPSPSAAGSVVVRFGGGPSTMAACAARRAAAMKFDLPAGSGMTGGRTFSSAASEAAMRSAGELPRPRPAPGSSGWSGGRSGSIGRRSRAGDGFTRGAGGRSGGDTSRNMADWVGATGGLGSTSGRGRAGSDDAIAGT